MRNRRNDHALRLVVYAFVAATGLASLAWEILWQIKSSLAIGVSARGTAITLAVTMGGMCIGSLASSRVLKEKVFDYPIRLYGGLEIAIGIAGLCLAFAFHQIELLDTWTYQQTAIAAPLIHILAIAAALIIPAVCMGATLPVFGLMAQQFQIPISLLYGLNTFGAAAGTLLAAYVIIPALGIEHTGWVIASLNILIGTICQFLHIPANTRSANYAGKTNNSQKTRLSPLMESAAIAATGFATFVLEISWFRAFVATFSSTTKTFANMLFSALVALGIAAYLEPIFKKIRIPLGLLLCLAGIGVLLVTPIIERFDIYVFPASMQATHNAQLPSPLSTQAVGQTSAMGDLMLFDSLFAMFLLIGLPISLLGMAVPWILDDQHSARRWGRLYALNTMAAIFGSLGAAWIFLPALGFARTAWIAGALVAVIGIVSIPRQKRLPWTACCVAAMLFAATFQAGIGQTRVLGGYAALHGVYAKVLKFFEGPDATVAVVEYDNGMRRLIIDGTSASAQSSADASTSGENIGEHYMAWMGHLPMLLAPDPKNALVICFGTGQTANAVRQENPQSVDIVDINKHVFQLAPYFTANQDVLKDPRVHAIVMDGRAYLRRVGKTYDIITLEPMPPTAAGVNALYSKEFYMFARDRLSSHGVIAQWLPFHAVDVFYAASIAKTFQNVFPNSILWIDKVSSNGILLGTKDDDGDLGAAWSGFARTSITRNLSEDEVRNAVWLNQKGMKIYGGYGEVVTDDNQLLAYGKAVNALRSSDESIRQNLEFLKQLAKDNAEISRKHD